MKRSKWYAPTSDQQAEMRIAGLRSAHRTGHPEELHHHATTRPCTESCQVLHSDGGITALVAVTDLAGPQLRQALSANRLNL